MRREGKNPRVLLASKLFFDQMSKMKLGLFNLLNLEAPKLLSWICAKF